MGKMDVMLMLVVLSCLVTTFAVGYSWALVQEIRRLRGQEKPKIKLGGHSDVRKDEGWMPYDAN